MVEVVAPRLVRVRVRVMVRVWVRMRVRIRVRVRVRVRVRLRLRVRVRVRVGLRMVEAVAPRHRAPNIPQPLRLALGGGIDVVDVHEDVRALPHVAW